MSERVTGERRAEVARTLRREYEAGSSVRSLAARWRRSYGWVHRLLWEAGTTMRGRGGNQRGKAVQ